MTAEYMFELKFKGNKEQIKTLLEILKHYTNKGDRDVFFTDFKIKLNGVSTVLEKIEDKDIDAGEAVITAWGPYGSTDFLSDDNIFIEIAESMPHTSFKGTIDSDEQYCVQGLKCSLKNDLLIIDTYYEENGEKEEAWAADVESKLDEDEFIELFELSDDCFEHDSYNYLLQCAYDEIDRTLKYADFMSIFGSYTKITKERYREIIKNEIPEYGILTPSKFLKTHEVGEHEHSEYDPVKKEFTVKPFF